MMNANYQCESNHYQPPNYSVVDNMKDPKIAQKMFLCNTCNFPQGCYVCQECTKYCHIGHSITSVGMKKEKCFCCLSNSNKCKLINRSSKGPTEPPFVAGSKESRSISGDQKKKRNKKSRKNGCSLGKGDVKCTQYQEVELKKKSKSNCCEFEYTNENIKKVPAYEIKSTSSACVRGKYYPYLA